MKSILAILLFGASGTFVHAEIANLPADVKEVVNQREFSIGKINRLYVQQLEKLKIEYTKRGDLDAASAIVVLINSVSVKEKPLPNNEKELREFLIGSQWKGPNSIQVFKENGRFHSAVLSPSYAITGRRSLTINWAPETNVNCVLNEDCTELRETNGLKVIWKRIH